MKVNCSESNESTRSLIYDESCNALTLAEIVSIINTLSEENAKLRQEAVFSWRHDFERSQQLLCAAALAREDETLPIFIRDIEGCKHRKFEEIEDKDNRRILIKAMQQ